jgi:hypothetical protein
VNRCEDRDQIEYQCLRIRDTRTAVLAVERKDYCETMVAQATISNTVDQAIEEVLMDEVSGRVCSCAECTRTGFAVPSRTANFFNNLRDRFLHQSCCCDTNSLNAIRACSRVPHGPPPLLARRCAPSESSISSLAQCLPGPSSDRPSRLHQRGRRQHAAFVTLQTPLSRSLAPFRHSAAPLVLLCNQLDHFTTSRAEIVREIFPLGG